MIENWKTAVISVAYVVQWCVLGGHCEAANSAGMPTGRIASRDLEETSGMAVSRQNEGIVWLHNDGRDSRIFATKTTGEPFATLLVAASIKDVEDIAIGPGPEPNRDYLYLGDIGDNDQRREEICVVRILEPVLSAQTRRTLPVREVEKFRFRYPDGAFDAEALFVDRRSGEIYIVTKEKRRARVFVAPAENRFGNDAVELKEVTRLKVGNVSGGDMSSDSAAILLRSENKGWLWRLGTSQSVVEVFRSELPTPVDVRGRSQNKNGEAIGFLPDSTAYLTVSEGRQQPLCKFTLDLEKAGRKP